MQVLRRAPCGGRGDRWAASSASSSSSYSSSSYSSSSSRPSRRSPSSRSRSGIWCTGVAVMTSRPKKASRASRTTATMAADARRSSGVPTAQPSSPPEPGPALLRVGGRAERPARCRGPTATVHSQPMASRPRASGRGPRRSSRSAAKNRTTGSTMTSEPMIQRTPSASAAADRADAVAPRGRARARSPGPARPGRRRPGGARARAVRPPPGGRPSGRGRRRRGRAGSSRRLTTPHRPGDGLLPAGGRTARLAVEPRLAGGRLLLAAVEPERPRVDAGRRGRRGAGRHASDGNRLDRSDRAGRASCPAPVGGALTSQT